MNKLKFIWIVIFVVGLGLRTVYLFHPIDTGSWREGDIAAISKNYYQNGMKFSYPQIAWGGTGPGYAEMEFPVYPYLIALTYKVFGVHDAIGRIWSFLFSLGTILLFFSLSKKLFKESTAIIASVIFTLNPLFLYISNTIQPEPLMFFFYVGAVLYFVKWVDNQSPINSFLLFVFTTGTFLAKLTSMHLGILFFLVIIVQKNWRFLFKSNILLIGIASFIIPVAWYWHAHNLYLDYGNSLGLSNEYHWIGWDFFTNPYFIRGIISREVMDIWMIPGVLMVLLALLFGNALHDRSFKFGFYWMLAVFIFYIIASRTTADTWAFYYHIFSVPAVAIMLGSSIELVYSKFTGLDKLQKVTFTNIIRFRKAYIIFGLFILLQSFTYIKTYQRLSLNYNTSNLYQSSKHLSGLIPKGSLIVVSGGNCNDETGHYVAYNSSYFFYWLGCKGSNVCVENQSIMSIEQYRKQGYSYFIGEKRAIVQINGFESQIRQKYHLLFEDNSLLVFKL